MSKHLTEAQQQKILSEMLELARLLTRDSVPLPDITTALGQLRDDMNAAYRASIELTVDRDTYREQFPTGER